jgi:hypothetical protein
MWLKKGLNLQGQSLGGFSCHWSDFMVCLVSLAALERLWEKAGD